MLARLRAALTYSNIVSTLCLLLVLGGGTAYAAATIGSDDIIDDSVRSVDLQNNDVRGVDVANNSLGGLDVDESELGKVPSARNADFLDGRNSSEFAPARDLTVTPPVPVSDPDGDDFVTYGLLYHRQGVTVRGACFNNAGGLGSDSATIGVNLEPERGSVYWISSNETARSEASVSNASVAAVSRPEDTNAVVGSEFEVVRSDNRVVSGSVTAEINDTDGRQADCTFAGTFVG